MSFEVVEDLRRFADEDSEIIGRDVLKIRLHEFADMIDSAMNDIVADYSSRVEKYAGLSVKSAYESTRLKAKLKTVELMLEIACRRKTAERCEMCCEDSSAGEGNGCNSPTHGEYPAEKECEPFVKILKEIREEGGVK